MSIKNAPTYTFVRQLYCSLVVSAGVVLSAGCQQAVTPGAADVVPAARHAALVGQDGAALVDMPGTVVNRYAILSSDAVAGSDTIEVSNIADLMPLNPGDLVMVIQMQGAKIAADDSASFGAVTDAQGAGRYEVATVRSVQGNAITLDVGCGGLRNDYVVAGKTQVIRVPEFSSLEVTATGSIVPKPWDGLQGGVVAIHVEDSAQIDGVIDASGFGFRGGAASNLASPPTTDQPSFVSAKAEDGGEKGESIAGDQAAYDLIGGRYGRGAPANGGGGGNTYRSGGGGGAHAGDAAQWTGAGVMDAVDAMAWAMDPVVIGDNGALAQSPGGGRGGYGWSDQAEDPLMSPPNGGAWGPAARRTYGGFGGRPIHSGGQSRLFLGGGGGAGSGDGGGAGSGGRGGGIVFVIAGKLQGAGQLAADGAMGENASATKQDGAGGGGGGGAVMLRTDSLSGLALRARGGAGGSQDNSGIEAAGPGGGGGGGIITAVAGADMQAKGGITGSSNSSTMMAFQSNGATLGAVGMVQDGSFASGDLSLPVCIPADVRVTLVEQPREATPGAPAHFAFTVENKGSSTLRNIKLDGAQLGEPADVSWTCAGLDRAVCGSPTGTGVLSMLAEIPAQGQVRIDVDAVPSKFATGQLGYRLAAKPSAVLTELTPQDNQAEVSANVVAKADLGIVLSPTPVNPQPASAALFRLLAANFGPNPAGGVRVEISLPPEVKDVAVLGEDWACQADLPKLHCQRTLLEVGSAPSLDIKITTPIAPGPLTVAAEISSDAQDIQLANNKAESTVQIPGGIVPPKAEPAPASGCSVSPTGAHSPASGMWLLVPALIAWLRQRRPRRAA